MIQRIAFELFDDEPRPTGIPGPPGIPIPPIPADEIFLIWDDPDLSGVRDGANMFFTIPNLPAEAHVWIYHQGVHLRQVPMSPSGTQCVRIGANVELGIAPGANDDLWCVIASTVPAVFVGLDNVVAASGPAAAAVYLQEIRESFYFNVHIRDINGNLKEIIERDVSSISWSYAPLGGCLEASITIRRPFDSFGDIKKDYEVEIWREPDQLGQAGARLPAQFFATGIQLGTAHIGARQLRWSGKILARQKMLRPDGGGDIGEHIVLRCVGHGAALRRIFIPGYSPAAHLDVGEVVRNLIDTYVLAGTKIKRTAALGLVQNTGIEVGGVGQFATYAASALDALANIGGNCEFGCNAEKEFYFTVRQNVVRKSYPIGGRIALFVEEENSDDEVHRVYLQGANEIYPVDIAPFQPGNQKEVHVAVGAINSSGAAQRWAFGYAAAHAPGNTTPSGRL